MQISVKTFQHLEPLLLEELKALGATHIQSGKRIVHCEGDIELLYKANYCLRTGLRVLVPVLSFPLRHTDELYRRCLKFDWEKYLRLNQTFAIDPQVNSEHFRHGHFASLKMKDAIADYFNQKHGKRPNVDPDDPDVRFHLHIDQDRVTISLDSSGHSLNQRGYRIDGGEAPLNEVLAAAMILISGWKGDSDFCDPFCGSGTLAIEAAMIAHNIPAQRVREGFGFMNWMDFDERVWKKVEREAEEAIVYKQCEILAADKEGRQLDIAKRNIAHAGVQGLIKLKKSDFFELTPESSDGVLITNPPYGERLYDEDIARLFRSIGDRLKHHWSGWTAWFISSNPESFKNIGLRPTRKIELLNGPLICRFMKYELFRGKKGEHKAES